MWRAVIVLPLLAGLTLAVAQVASADRYLYNHQHWARTTPGLLRLGFEYGPGVNVALLTEVLADWSLSPALDLGMIGPTDRPDVCANDTSAKLGVVVVCFGPDFSPSVATVMTECVFHPVPDCDNNHIWAAKILLYTNLKFIYCHEVGHTLGLGHGGNGCLASTSPCPGSQDYADLEALYDHADSYNSVSVASFTQGVAACGTAPTPSPTSTPTPAPSVTPTVTPTASPTPTPACWPPRAKRCR